jgi:hypothetical protein
MANTSREQTLLAILQDPDITSATSSANTNNAPVQTSSPFVSQPLSKPTAFFPSSSQNLMNSGVKIAPHQTITLDSNPLPSALLSSKQLDAQAITIVPSKLEYKLGSYITVNKDYICYAVRGKYYTEN